MNLILDENSELKELNQFSKQPQPGYPDISRGFYNSQQGSGSQPFLSLPYLPTKVDIWIDRK